jgi:hypothetical protein
MQLLLMDHCTFLGSFGGMWVIHAVISAFLGILFIQSGLDKTFDYRSNLDWLQGHFAESLLGGSVPVLLSMLTFMELATGLLAAVGAVEAIFFRTYCFALLGNIGSAVTLLMLFFGQRIAKDYAGAASLVPYFIVVIIGMFFLS